MHRHDAVAAEHVPEGAGLLIVNDTRQALTSLGAYGRERFTGAVIAVTGSVGKTTTKEMLRLILAGSGRVEAAAASYNNHWGVPLTLARLDPDADYAVVEIGMNHPGWRRRISAGAARWRRSPTRRRRSSTAWPWAATRCCRPGRIWSG